MCRFHWFCRARLSSKYKWNLRSHSTVPRGILLGYGNPLLDITVHASESMLKKYNLKSNDAVLSSPKIEGIFEEAETMNPQYLAGGATQNTIRVAQWLLQTNYATSFIGCVGNDNQAKILEKRAMEVGVRVHYQVHPILSTGMCCCIVTGNDRSMVTKLGASRKFTHDFIEDPKTKSLIEQAQVFYVGGFPFTSSPTSVLKIAEHARQHNKTLIMNFSAPFLCDYFVDPEINIMAYVDIIFGNGDEAAAFCSAQGIKADSCKEMALAISNLPKHNQSKHRIVVITNGCEPIVVAHDSHVFEVKAKKIPRDEIVDTIGCGDAFVAGFLSQFVQGTSLENCLSCAIYAAGVIIRQHGCSYPSKPDFETFLLKNQAEPH